MAREVEKVLEELREEKYYDQYVLYKFFNQRKRVEEVLLSTYLPLVLSHHTWT